MAEWQESTSIGAVLLKQVRQKPLILSISTSSLSLPQSDDLLRVYPPFVNFFEMSKEALARCERVYPRFHAFLKVRGHLWGSAH